jgi:hypothetical protein
MVFLLGWLFFRAQPPSSLRRYYWIALVTKLSAGCILGIIYKYYLQNGDTWNIFSDAIELSGLASADFSGYIRAVFLGYIPEAITETLSYSGQPRALLMVRVTSVLALLTGGNYWLSGAYISLFSFLGLWTLMYQLVERYPNATHAALMAFIFLPTNCFWGSGITKEAIYLGGFGFLAAWFWPYFYCKNYYRWPLSALMLLVLIPLKYYYMAVFLAVLFTSIIHYRLKLGGKLQWTVLCSLLFFGVSWLHPNLNLGYVAELMKDNATQILAASNHRAIIGLIDHENPLVWAGINFPWAVITGLYRPNLGDWGSWFQHLAVIEYFILLVLTCGRLVSLERDQLASIDWWASMIYVIILAGMLTLSTPNFGTLVRFKASFLPIFAFMILHQNRWWDWICEKFPWR